MSIEPTVVLNISDSGTGSLAGLDRDRLHQLAELLRQVTRSYAGDARILTRFDVRISDTDAVLVVDLPARDVLLSGVGIGLSHTEFEIFAQLVRHPRVVIGRQEFAVTAGGRSVDVHLSRIRTKLGAFGSMITTVRGTGYRFDPTRSVRVVTDPVRLRTA
ncbi:winged helix-turn-helix domain-containing protein [Rhodococcoides kyotonense]|uniref:Transcriptional regulatory protein, C terminal n=1 Tax=Rhodococcoides kyotonense TaxID=398843 RepID=A0A239GC02_9NOCA|nr:winged helix-turn-helix domain-containing protein [Rhodococcus kyotonensis]SNS66697.1 Transcriptional regulatory protein, C terminal [Rhodococcus kyotonensis]